MAGIALAVYLLVPDEGVSELIVVAAASAAAVVAGLVGAWLHRLTPLVSMLTTAGLLAIGSVLIVGAGGTLQAYAEGGFNNIGAGILLIVGAIMLPPSIALAVLLAASYRKAGLSVMA
ncbi:MULTISPECIES: hypothetical protein [unclassified Microbacterium]|uniref:hypothetical protein n=1 Tax=unclassified Microbacterium TaxID=2609290 RepID=UPI003863C8A9